jgi:hypothetical protein
MIAPAKPGLPSDPAAARKVALVVSFAMVAGVTMLAVVLTGVAPTDGSAADPDFLSGLPVGPKTLTSGIGAVLCLASIAFARRMHDDRGALEERVRRALSAHLVASALAEAAAVLGFAFVIASKSWEHALPLALGGALLVLGLIRAMIVFGRLVDETAR